MISKYSFNYKHKTDQLYSGKTGIPDFSVLLIFLVFTLMGIAILPLLNLQLKPNKSLPELTVNYYWHNASAKVIESEVTVKLERLLNGLGNLKEISSVSKKGNGSINLKFNKQTRLDVSKFEVASIIRRVYPDLPQGVSYPIINGGSNDNNTPLLSYTVSSPASPYYIAQYATKNIEPKLASVKGVNKVNIYGHTPYEFAITYNSQKLKLYNITTAQFKLALSNYFSESPIGFISLNSSDSANSSHFRVLLKAKNNELNWSNIPIANKNGRIIYFSNVATVQFQEQSPENYYRINGLNTLNIVIYPNKGTNAIKLSKNIKETISALSKELPPSYSIILSHDSTEFLSKELKKIGLRSFASIIILLIFVLIITRRVRYLILIITGLFINLLLASFLFFLFKIDIHLYSLAGITVSFGIIIDNSIVMIDHYRSHKNRKVFISLLAATLTTVGALSMVFLLSETQKINLIDFVWVVVICLMVSLIVAYYFIPSFLNKKPIYPKKNKRFYKRKRKIVKFNRFYIRLIVFTKRYKWVFILLAILAFGLPINLIPERIEKQTQWATFYNRTLGSEWYKNNVHETLYKIVGGSYRLFAEYVFDSYGYNDPQQTKLHVIGKMPEGCTIHQLNTAIEKMEHFISQYNEVEKFITSINSYRHGSIEIIFKDEYENSSFPYLLKGQLTSKAISLGGLDWSVFGVGRGFSNAIGLGYKPYRIQLEGYNYEALYKWAEILSDSLKTNKRVRGIDIEGEFNWYNTAAKHEYVVEFNAENLSEKNISIAQFYNTLSQKLLYSSINPIFYKGELIPISIKPNQADNFNKWQLLNSPLVANNKEIKFPLLAQITKKKSGNDIYKKNQQYQLVVAWDFIGPSALAEKVKNKYVERINNQLPLGYKAHNSNWYYWNNKDKKQYYLLFLTIIIIYFICTILLESFMLPLAIIGLIPISFIGVFLTFYLFDISFDQGGFASFVLLSGLIVNSGVYIAYDFKVYSKERKQNLLSIYIKAFNHKITPIFLTIISTLLGMVPFILNSQGEAFWFSFASGTIGGLLFSLFALLLYFPLFIKTSFKNVTN